MQTYNIDVKDIKAYSSKFEVYDRVNLNGIVYTARDAAHKRIMGLIEEGKPLPFEINGACIYYAGPTPTPEGRVIGSCGPTTSSRMDPYAPTLLNMGLSGIIGKGPRNKEVTDAVKANNAVYFCAIGGAGAIYSKCVKSLEVIAFEDLGCESVKRLELKDFPVYVGIC